MIATVATDAVIALNALSELTAFNELIALNAMNKVSTTIYLDRESEKILEDLKWSERKSKSVLVCEMIKNYGKKGGPQSTEASHVGSNNRGEVDTAPKLVTLEKSQSTEGGRITIKKLSDWDEGRNYDERRTFVRRASDGIREIFGKMTPLWNESRLREYCNEKDASDGPYDKRAEALLVLFNKIANMPPQEEEEEAE